MIVLSFLFFSNTHLNEKIPGMMLEDQVFFSVVAQRCCKFIEEWIEMCIIVWAAQKYFFIMLPHQRNLDKEQEGD